MTTSGLTAITAAGMLFVCSLAFAAVGLYDVALGQCCVGLPLALAGAAMEAKA